MLARQLLYQELYSTLSNHVCAEDPETFLRHNYDIKGDMFKNSQVTN